MISLTNAPDREVDTPCRAWHSAKTHSILDIRKIKIALTASILGDLQRKREPSILIKMDGCQVIVAIIERQCRVTEVLQTTVTRIMPHAAHGLVMSPGQHVLQDICILDTGVN